MNTSSKAGRSLGCFFARLLTLVAGGWDFRPSLRSGRAAMMPGVATRPEEG